MGLKEQVKEILFELLPEIAPNVTKCTCDNCGRTILLSERKIKNWRFFKGNCECGWIWRMSEEIE